MTQAVCRSSGEMRFATDVHPPTADAVSIKASKVAADPPRIKSLPGSAQAFPYPALAANL